ncbi:hypothetical protein EG68_08062 [Paragonimus skrjabini miyazakii]|uniref:Dol-P-Glc:Glc(2)Man(9)GlcNAc(2)-PP-Dol alpha-1,2-glucosyltransferase n=1 Tax=Paragonimus skrjabini miyazakii TaxID=59628 RepID=A0A8S9YNZ6_9TREM|nr:hypothetical protein EG68_08062 [Paragonimus skrjabini miyazakii]
MRSVKMLRIGLKSSEPNFKERFRTGGNNRSVDESSSCRSPSYSESSIPVIYFLRVMENSVVTSCRDGLVIILLSFSFVIILSALTAYCFSSVQPGPYMDEYFHTRQTLTYLAGNWSIWDNKISTPPGTYILFVTLYKLTDALFVHLPQSPSILFFRYFSAIFSGLNYVLLLQLYSVWS